MVDKGLSRFIPGEVHEAHRPVATSAWELAALSYMIAIWLSVIGSLILGFSISFHTGLGGIFLGGPSLFVGAAVSVVALTLVARLHGRQTNELGRQMLDAALTLFFALGLLSVVIGIIGFFAAFSDSGFGVLIDDLFLHLADIAIGVLAIVWALGEIAHLKGAMTGAQEQGTVEAGAVPPFTPPAGSYAPSPSTMPPYAPPPAPPTTTLPTTTLPTVPPPTEPPPTGPPPAPPGPPTP
jgi:hypothetical protein